MDIFTPTEDEFRDLLKKKKVDPYKAEAMVYALHLYDVNSKYYNKRYCIYDICSPRTNLHPQKVKETLKLAGRL